MSAEKKGQELRTISNSLIIRSKTLKHAVLFLALINGIGTVVLLATTYFAKEIIISSILANSVDQNVVPTVEAMIRNVGYISIIVLGMSSFLMIVGGFFISNRIVAPLVRVKQVVNDLKQGNYKTQGVLRQGDELQDLMTEVNELARILEKKHGAKS